MNEFSSQRLVKSRSRAAVRPAGRAYKVRAWAPASNRAAPPDLDLVLSEFADPGGEEIFFATDLTKDVVDDELIGRSPKANESSF